MKISIVTVCFNSKTTIEETLESVKKQTYSNYEHIIIDGKSIDGTVEILNQYKLLNPEKVKVISESDTGIYNAMNKGIKMSSGELIVFLNSDDTFNPNALEIINKNYSENTDIIYGNVSWEESFDGKTYIKNLNLKPDNIDNYNIEIMSREHLDKIKNAHNATFVKTEIMKNNLFDENLKICSDYKFFLTMYKQRKKVSYIPNIITTMKMGGISTTQLENGIKEHVKCELDILGETNIDIRKHINKIRIQKHIKNISKRIMPKNIYIKLRYINKGWILKND